MHIIPQNYAPNKSFLTSNISNHSYFAIQPRILMKKFIIFKLWYAST
jgi:hypothetical protein